MIQPSNTEPPSTRTPTSAESVATWTMAERESFRLQISGFLGLLELARENAAIVQDVRQLIPGHEDSPSLAPSWEAIFS